MNENNNKLICLLTDFGPKGKHYVAQMKAVLLKINPFIKIIDISHNINPFSIIEGSYVFKTTYKLYPPHTIFIIVIDPGVGSQRRILAVRTVTNHYLIAPDNGLFKLVFNGEDVTDCVEVKNQSYFQHPVSETFHGRDIMAPIGAYLSKNFDFDSIGPKIEFSSVKTIKIPLKIHEKNNRITGIVQYIDSFGNLTTNFPVSNDLHLVNSYIKLKYKRKITLLSKGKSYTGSFSRFFSEVPRDELIFLKGSTGYLEISLNQGSAASYLNLKIGDHISISLESNDNKRHEEDGY